MINIGYAVFGSPKGISVVSNGLFKELNLDKSLYLNNSHIVLEKGQQALMIRRIPANSQNLERKDALLLVLYEHAAQYAEKNRPGSFVGSAISFREKMPNAEKMIAGLVYLFSKMKENVDPENRFKSIDSSNWNIDLPDATKEFGMFENSNLRHKPLSNSKTNFVVKLNDFEKDATSLLSNFCLNHAFHTVDYLYASNSNDVIKNLTINGFSHIEFSSLFNYDKHLTYYKDKLVNDNGKLTSIKNEATTLQNKIVADTNQINSLASELISKRSKVEQIDKETLKATEDFNHAKQKKAEAVRELDELKRLGNNIKQKNHTKTSSPEDRRKIDELAAVFVKASKKIKEYTNVKFKDAPKGVSDIEKNKYHVEYYFDQMPERKEKVRKRNGFILASLLIIILTFLGLFLYKNVKLNQALTKIDNSSIENKKYKDSIGKVRIANDERNQLLNNINKYKKDTKSADYKKFRKHAKTLLGNFFNNKYKKGSSEFIFIQSYPWEFWEFDYQNETLVNKLNIDNNKYFVNLDSYIKPINPKPKWLGESKIDEMLANYLKESNDIYQKIPQSILDDKKTLEKHFKWVIEKANSKAIKDLKENEKIGLPYFKK